MAITADGWLTWAARKPGPPEKQYSVANRASGYIPHSMVGALGGWYSRLFDMSRQPDGRFTPNAAASVHGSILTNGHVIQHYPLTASCWASGSSAANTRFVAFENESVYTNGRPDETKPFTPPQVDSNLRIIQEIMDWQGWEPYRPRDRFDLSATLYEHREMTRFGAAPTACPSERAAPLWARIGELEDDLSAEQYNELRAEIAALKASQDLQNDILKTLNTRDDETRRFFAEAVKQIDRRLRAVEGA